MQSKYLYFEDYQVGEKGETGCRTLGEGDLTQFASISGDFAPPHMDRHLMANSVYGVRIGHGWFAMSLVLGMFSYLAPHIVGRDTPAAYLRDITASYPCGFNLGDTVKLRWSVEEKTDDLAQPGFGIVKTAYQLVNQDGNSACEGVVTTGVRMRSAEGAKPQFEPGVPVQFEEWVPDFNKVYFLEDFVVGEGEETYGRTITETDVVNFMGLTQDYNRLYLDSAYAKETVFREKIAPPMLVAVIITGFTYLYESSYYKIKKLAKNYAGHLSEEVSFLAPAQIGDSLHCRKVVESSRVSKSKPDRGIITFKAQVINQRNEVLVEIRTLFMLPTKAAAIEPIKTDWVISTIKRSGEDLGA